MVSSKALVDVGKLDENAVESVDSRDSDERYRQEKINRLKIDNKTRAADSETRLQLIQDLKNISLWWLRFTAFFVVVTGIKCPYYGFSDGVAIAFITTSLATVLGLWIIGLRYFFYTGK